MTCPSPAADSQWPVADSTIASNSAATFRKRPSGVMLRCISSPVSTSRVGSALDIPEEDRQPAPPNSNSAVPDEPQAPRWVKQGADHGAVR